MRRKVRQISQGVEDINWQGSHDASSDKEAEIELHVTPNDDLGSSTVVDVINGENAVREAQWLVNDESSRPMTPEEAVVLPHSVPDIRNFDPDGLVQSPVKDRQMEGLGRPSSFSENNEKRLKRKFLERGTSQGPIEENEKHRAEPLKRPRDDADKDDNPRDVKKPSPPPSPLRSSSSPNQSKMVSISPTSLSFLPHGLRNSERIHCIRVNQFTICSC